MQNQAALPRLRGAEAAEHNNHFDRSKQRAGVDVGHHVVDADR